MEKFLTARQVSKLVGLGERFITEMASRDKDPIPHIDVGTSTKRNYRFRASDVEAWLNEEVKR